MHPLTPAADDTAIQDAMGLLASIASTFEHDRPIFERLHLCRTDLDRQLQARKWNRSAAATTARSARAAMRRRHTSGR